MSIVFKKNTPQTVASLNDGCYLNGWSSSSTSSDTFITDSVNIVILKKGTYQIIINVNISAMMTNNIAFYCLNSKTNVPLENVSILHMTGPLLGTSQSTGIIHGIITVDTNLSFKVVSNTVKGSLVIKESQISLIAL
jgi:hypothetical protein